MKARSGSAARYVPEPGEHFHGWTVVRIVGRNARGTLIVEVRCECGKQAERVFSMIHRGESTNCGCRRKRRKVHGSYYLRSSLHRDADGMGPVVKHNQKPTPGGTLLSPEVVEHMRRYGVTRIEPAEVEQK